MGHDLKGPLKELDYLIEVRDKLVITVLQKGFDLPKMIPAGQIHIYDKDEAEDREKNQYPCGYR
ncbi:MAG TPA: hypothetical protein DCR97_14865 [Deltaproteobacteria bacterium]|nr:hypothetical protein [Deltaproteobacteria bacterium]